MAIQLEMKFESEGGINNLQKPDTYKGIYAMHKYWSKKPHNLVSSYIQEYSKPGDIILDSFCGSGVSVIESVRLNRRAVGIDINPIAVFSTKMALEHIDLKLLNESFKIIRDNVTEKIRKLYYTDCPNCGNPNAITTHVIWENNSILELWVECDSCKITKVIKQPTEKDHEAALSPIFQPAWYPETELIENYRINVGKNMCVRDLFTPRALVGLSIIFEEIQSLEDLPIRNVMNFCFSATLPQASNMVFVIRRRGKNNNHDQGEKPKAEVGSWVIGYWIPQEHFEINVWRCFENRFERIARGKRDVNSLIPKAAIERKTFSELLSSDEGYLVINDTATKLDILGDSIDYVFIDPPHGNRIPYLELSLMWNSWLGFKSNWEEEIIVSEARSRKKDIDDYQIRMEKAFSELWRVLKPGKYLSVAFNSLDDDTWLSMINVCLETGFKIIEIKPLEYSARSVVQDTRKNALKTDFVISCQKVLPFRIYNIDFSNNIYELEKLIRTEIQEKSRGIQTYEIINHVIVDSIPKGVIYKVSDILNVLEKNYSFSDGSWHNL